MLGPVDVFHKVLCLMVYDRPHNTSMSVMGRSHHCNSGGFKCNSSQAIIQFCCNVFVFTSMLAVVAEVIPQ
jgi:hypothetical protein